MLCDRSARRPLWLLTGHREGQTDVLTVTTGGDNVETLPVFSFKEEADLFLLFGVPGTGWRVGQTTLGELISLLYGPCAAVEKVALDPSVEILGEGMAALVSLSREDFVRILTDEGGLAEPQRNCFRRRRPSASRPLRLGGGNRC